MNGEGGRTAAGEVTRLLDALASGDEKARNRLYPLVYEELRQIARARMSGGGHQTLQPTALVHEAYLKLLGGANPRWESRAHFFGAAAEAMRQILIDRARAKSRLKRGGGARAVELREDLVIEEQRAAELLDLDRALTQLAKLDSNLARVVELRYFAGLTVGEVAEVLGLSPRTVDRMWLTARAWLKREMRQGSTS